MALAMIPGAPDSKAKAFADMKVYLDEEKATRVTAQIETGVLSRAVRDLKISANKYATQIPILEDKVMYLEDKVVEVLN
jgi:hypothetical protein